MCFPAATPDRTCINVRPSRVARYCAVRRLVRPYEVAALIPRSRFPTLPAWLWVTRTGAWLQSRFREGTLAYFADPDVTIDQWCSPAATLGRGGGDCDDLAILATSLLVAAGVDAYVVVGEAFNGWRWDGHAWVEGADEHGGFLLEATSGRIARGWRPAWYRAEAFLPHDPFRLVD